MTNGMRYNVRIFMIYHISKFCGIIKYFSFIIYASVTECNFCEHCRCGSAIFVRRVYSHVDFRQRSV